MCICGGAAGAAGRGAGGGDLTQVSALADVLRCRPWLDGPRLLRLRTVLRVRSHLLLRLRAGSILRLLRNRMSLRRRSYRRLRSGPIRLLRYRPARLLLGPVYLRNLLSAWLYGMALVALLIAGPSDIRWLSRTILTAGLDARSGLAARLCWPNLIRRLSRPVLAAVLVARTISIPPVAPD